MSVRQLLRLGCLFLFPALGLIAGSQSYVPYRHAALASATPIAPKTAAYTEFRHDIKEHSQTCSECHKFPSKNWKSVRPEADAFEDVTEYPQHDSCLKCHTQQFFTGSPPAICSICHISPSPDDPRRHLFPNPRDAFDKTPKGMRTTTKFSVNFPHVKHIDIVADTRPRGAGGALYLRASTRSAAEESCAVCHSTLAPQGKSTDEFYKAAPRNPSAAFWLRKGTFKTSPTGHSQCFTCHSQESGLAPAPADCGSCHKPLKPPVGSDFLAAAAERSGVTDKLTLSIWRRRDGAGKFRHELASHSEMACASCHNVTTMDTANPLSTRVPISSCAPCHIMDGTGLNLEAAQRAKNPRSECVMCHVSLGRSPIPASHNKAVAESGD